MTATYAHNPACGCAWCQNGGKTPQPGSPEALGYDEPHNPPGSHPPWAATSTHGGRVDPTAIIGHAPEYRDWKRGDPAWQPVIAPDARIEAYVTVDAGVKRPTRIGANTWLMKKVHVGHDAILGEGCEIAPMSSIGGEVIIGNRVKLGQGALIKPRVTIGDDAVIGMGSVVIRDVPAGETWAGNPARLLA